MIKIKRFFDSKQHTIFSFGYIALDSPLHHLHQVTQLSAAMEINKEGRRGLVPHRPLVFLHLLSISDGNAHIHTAERNFNCLFTPS